MDNFREYVAQMREAAPRSDDVMQISKELWLQIADMIEEQGNMIEDLGVRIASLLAVPRNDTSSVSPSGLTPSPRGEGSAVEVL